MQQHGHAMGHADAAGSRDGYTRHANGVVRDLFLRHPDNPILTAAGWPYAANSVFNPGAVRLASGETVLLVRVEDRRGMSHLTAARSQDGYTNWRVDPQPTLDALPEEYPEELWGVEDARIVWLEELKRYAITYTAYSRNGPLVSLALTEDFTTFERRGPIMAPEDKDAAFFPRRFGGRWALIHRPVPAIPGAKANMWLSFSPDLQMWGDHGRGERVKHADGPWGARTARTRTSLPSTPYGIFCPRRAASHVAGRHRRCQPPRRVGYLAGHGGESLTGTLSTGLVFAMSTTRA